MQFFKYIIIQMFIFPKLQKIIPVAVFQICKKCTEFRIIYSLCEKPRKKRINQIFVIAVHSGNICFYNVLKIFIFYNPNISNRGLSV
jgi:hypothetical protein